MLRAEGHRAVANFSDITDPGSGTEIIEAAIREYGRVDIVINNAGVIAFDSIEHVTTAQFATDIGVHLIGAYNVTRAAWPYMREQGYGRVVMTSSTSIFGQDNSASYCAGKAGIIGLTAGLATEGEPVGILVNAVAPSAGTRMAASPVSTVASNTARPELAAQAVGWLAHETCRQNGRLFHAGNGRVSRIFLGETHGFVAPDLTVESVAAHEYAINDQSEYITPESVFDAITYHRGMTPQPAVPTS
jgi:NAD(P)-dependent dehydrogenase (short-subunit alcohol dehydrogenase family)